MIPTNDAVGPTQLSSIRLPVSADMARITSVRGGAWANAFAFDRKPAADAPTAVNAAP